jgi:7-cyano-7-deazaguanine synthase
MNRKSSLVLLSAGLDSTVNLFLAAKKTDIKMALTFNYGQLAAEKEIQHSQKLTKLLSISHQVIDLPWLNQMSPSSLNSTGEAIPQGRAISIDDFKISTDTAKSVWVPNRNGLFLNIAASFADAQKIDYIIPGFNKEEAQTFPDNSEAFMKASTQTFKFSTSNQAEVQCYTINMNKTEILKVAVDEKMPLHLIWPCYFNYNHWCGQCESCQRTQRAMVSNQVDTSEYFNSVAKGS